MELNMERILLVCPELPMTDDLTFFLQHSGFQVVSAIEDHQAMVEMGRSEPDLILMRQNSHSLNGDELCARIRSQSTAPIIIIGRDQHQTAGVEFLEMGADAYLATPLNARELLARIRALLRRSHPSLESVRENTPA